jgi:elongation factor 1 alpha-like protein
MSRSRGYDDDDLDDYDDYDDDDDYDYKPQTKQASKKAVPAVKATATAGKATAPASGKPVPKGGASGVNASAKSNASAAKSGALAVSSSKAASVPPPPPTKLVQQASSSGPSVSDDEDAFSNPDSLFQSSSHEQDHLPSITVVVAGHVDAGKSTLVGNLLYQLGLISSRVIEANEREAARLGKSSFHFAWVTDESSEERERGVTVNAATKLVLLFNL